GAAGFTSAQVIARVAAEKLAAQSTIDAAFFYALLREGALTGAGASAASARFTIDVDAPIQPLYYDVVLLAPEAVSAAVTAAIAKREVPAKVADELQAIRAILDRS